MNSRNGIGEIVSHHRQNDYLQTAKYFIEEHGHFAGYDAKRKDP